MNRMLFFSMTIFCSLLVVGIAAESESFVIKKKKAQKGPSIAKLQEQYAQELTELIKLVPTLHTKLAALQQELIENLQVLLEDLQPAQKNELEHDLKKARELHSTMMIAFDETSYKTISANNTILKN